MDFDAYLTAIRRESDTLASAATRGLDQPVPSCPGWTVRDVVRHTGAIHRQKGQIVRERWLDEQPPLVDPPQSGLLEWFRSGANSLLATLDATDPATPIYSWFPPDQTVGFWYRRMAHETVIHRVDAELAHGVPLPLDAALAADGIDEVLTVFMVGSPEWSEEIRSEPTLRLECTDQPGTWDLRFMTWSGTNPESGNEYQDEPGVVFDEVAGPSAVAQGSASDLDLFLWGRSPGDRLAVEGDTSLLDALRSIAAAATV